MTASSRQQHETRCAHEASAGGARNIARRLGGLCNSLLARSAPTWRHALSTEGAPSAPPAALFATVYERRRLRVIRPLADPTSLLVSSIATLPTFVCCCPQPLFSVLLPSLYHGSPLSIFPSLAYLAPTWLFCTAYSRSRRRRACWRNDLAVDDQATLEVSRVLARRLGDRGEVRDSRPAAQLTLSSLRLFPYRRSPPQTSKLTIQQHHMDHTWKHVLIESTARQTLTAARLIITP